MDLVGIYLLTGAVAGLLAGLFGVGGGLIIVPALALLLPRQGVAPEVVMQVAIGTSLAVIALTSLSSAAAHHRRDGVLWDAFRAFAPGLVLGALAGAALAHALPGIALKRIVGVGALLVALQMFLDLRPGPARPLPGKGGLLAAGGLIGALSSLIGIGGGSLTVPFMTWRSVDIRRAVGTSAACGVPIAWAGALGFIFAGWNVPARPEWSLGYVSILGFLGIAAASVLVAPMGARLAHRLPPAMLRRAFALLLTLIGLRMLAG